MAVFKIIKRGKNQLCTYNNAKPYSTKALSIPIRHYHRFILIVVFNTGSPDVPHYVRRLVSGTSYTQIIIFSTTLKLFILRNELDQELKKYENEQRSSAKNVEDFSLLTSEQVYSQTIAQ